MSPPRDLLMKALEADDRGAIRSLLETHEDLRQDCGRPWVTLAHSVETAEWLLGHGGSVEAAAKWWAPGFYTRSVDAEVAAFLVARGAELTPHAASGLGLADRLKAMIDSDPSVVHAKGGDGCTPLHFSREVGIARMLLDRGAAIDARDDDHNSTPAQWLIGDRPEIVRYLLKRGAAADIFMAAALGDRELAEDLIRRDSRCVSFRIGKAPEFPPLGHEHRGGTIYQWTLAFNSYAHQIALLKGHPDVFELLYEHSDVATRLLVNCVLGRRAEAEAIVRAHPGLVASLPPVDHELVAKYCWETNTNYKAVQLMLDVGFPVAHPETSHGYTPLHNAAWAGSGDLVELLIARGHPLDFTDPTFHSTPLGFALYDCLHEKRHPEGEFVRVARALLDAGSPWDVFEYPTGHAGLDELFRERMPQRIDGAALLGDETALNGLLGPQPGGKQLADALAGAAKGGHLELCRKLIARGAPVNAMSGPHADTPLMFAARAGSDEVVELLLEHGARVASRNENGTTALHMAVWFGLKAETVALMLRHGGEALIDAANKFDYTPRRIAQEKGREEILALFGPLTTSRTDPRSA